MPCGLRFDNWIDATTDSKGRAEINVQCEVSLLRPQCRCRLRRRRVRVRMLEAVLGAMYNRDGLQLRHTAPNGRGRKFEGQGTQ